MSSHYLVVWPQQRLYSLSRLVMSYSTSIDTSDCFGSSLTFYYIWHCSGGGILINRQGPTHAVRESDKNDPENCHGDTRSHQVRLGHQPGNSKLPSATKVINWQGLSWPQDSRSFWSTPAGSVHDLMWARFCLRLACGHTITKTTRSIWLTLDDKHRLQFHLGLSARLLSERHAQDSSEHWQLVK